MKQKSNYQKEIQDIINNIIKELTPVKDLATYLDVIASYEKFKSEIDKDHQNKIVEKYII